PTKWQPSSTHGYKLNIDAAILESQQCINSSSTGFVLVAVAKKHLSPLNPKNVEAAALNFGINWATKVFTSLEAVESNVQVVVSTFKNAQCYCSELGCFLKDVNNLLTTFSDISISYVSRECNNIAHSLAKLAFRLDDELSWMEEILPPIMFVVISDCSI
ncbi:hypothetical protein PanWU01x14_368170, partial [Parasponia andersonii]